MALKKEEKQEKKRGVEKKEAVAKPHANDRPLILAGYFEASGGAGSDLRLYEIPAYYNVINVASAVLDKNSLLEFKFRSRNINRHMLKEVQAEKKVKVLLAVGGKDGSIGHLNQSGKISNFYNSLAAIYREWGFDGIHFELHQVIPDSLSYIIKAIKWFHESFPRAMISIGAGVEDVSPTAQGIYGKWNRLVPLLDALKSIINRVQIRAYGYGNTFGKLKKDLPMPPLGDPSRMLAFIYRSYAEPFRFAVVDADSQFNDLTGYYGIETGKLALEVQPCLAPGLECHAGQYITPPQLKQVMKELGDQYNGMTGEIMISSIDDDKKNGFRFSSQCIGTGEALPGKIITGSGPVKQGDYRDTSMGRTPVSPLITVNLVSKLREHFPRELFSQRLRLRPITLEDARAVNELAGDSEVSGSTLNIPYPLDYRATELWLNNQTIGLREGQAAYFAVELKDQKRLIGSVSLAFSQEHQRAEMGFWIGKKYWNHGYGTEAASAVLAYGFNELNLNRIFATHFKSNQAAARVLEKIGMKYEAYMPKHFIKWGAFEDGCICGILKEDFTK